MNWHDAEWLTDFSTHADTNDFFIEIVIPGVGGPFVRGPFALAELAENVWIARTDWPGASVTIHERQCRWLDTVTYAPLREDGDVR